MWCFFSSAVKSMTKHNLRAATNTPILRAAKSAALSLRAAVRNTVSLRVATRDSLGLRAALSLRAATRDAISLRATVRDTVSLRTLSLRAAKHLLIQSHRVWAGYWQ